MREEEDERIEKMIIFYVKKFESGSTPGTDWERNFLLASIAKSLLDERADRSVREHMSVTKDR